MHYLIGTRGSKLALIQAEYVKKRLEAVYKDDTFSIKHIQTTGDKNPNQALYTLGSKGVFTDEIEKQLLSGEIAMAIHSMKDMPGEIDERLTFAKAWDREDPRDVLILNNAKNLDELLPGAVIGTGSKRRACQLKQMRPDLKIVNLRGNVDTRIKKLRDEKQGLDGIIIAAAGINRLNRQDEISCYLPLDDMIPAPTQGILAIELRKDNEELLDKINSLADEKTNIAARAERKFINDIGGDCRFPIGAYYSDEGIFYALYGKEDCSRLVTKKANVSDYSGIDDMVDDVVNEIKKQLDEE